MKNPARVVSILPMVLMLVAFAAQAQSTQDGACPQLPANSGLTWQHKATAKSEFCRAMRVDGTEAFGLYIAAESPFKPKRGDRAEQASVDGHPIYWYRSELAANPDVQARETLVELGDGRLAHMWIQAVSPDQLGQAMQQTQGLHFQGTRLSSN